LAVQRPSSYREQVAPPPPTHTMLRRCRKYASTLFHLLLHSLGLQPAHTHTTEAERAALARYAAGRRRLVEIGVYEGSTTTFLADRMAGDGVIVGVDPFVPGRFGVSWCRLIARRQIARHPLRRSIALCEMFSHEAAARLPGVFDFVFIDGDHAFAAVKLDWESWSSRIVPGGVVALHDSRVPRHCPAVAAMGSVAYFEEHVQHDARFELVEQVDSLSILRRK